MAVTRPQNWLAGMLLATALMVTAAHAREAGQGSGLAVPRFVSIKSDKVNVHSGPTRDHDITWIYTRAGLPVEITAEYENWRRVRDWEGAEGWVYHSLLSGRRTGLVRANPKTHEDYIPIYASADAKSAVAAIEAPAPRRAPRRSRTSRRWGRAAPSAGSPPECAWRRARPT